LNKKAFSLIELLIVIVIIGVVYTLAIRTLDRTADTKIRVTLENLKEYLASLEYDENAKVLCLDDCDSCRVLLDNKEANILNGFVDSSVKKYRYDFYQGMQIIMDDVYFNRDGIEEDVCFSYEINKNGVGEQIFIEFHNKVYDYSSYFGKTPVYNTLAEAMDAKDRINNEVIK